MPWLCPTCVAIPPSRGGRRRSVGATVAAFLLGGVIERRDRARSDLTRAGPPLSEPRERLAARLGLRRSFRVRRADLTTALIGLRAGGLGIPIASVHAFR